MKSHDPQSNVKVVISGIAGRFPKSNNVAEFQQNLLNKVDCTTSEHGRWESDLHEVPQNLGACNDIQKFDRVFFGVHEKLTVLSDPVMRMLLEHCFEAVIDAGFNPRSLRGSNISVYTATSVSESEKIIFSRKVQRDGFGIMGGSRAMVANRVSFFFGFNGSSVNLDSGCCGSATALERAYHDIKNGLCDGAIVAGGIVGLHPQISYQFRKLGRLSADGKTRSFDDSADGQTRSDGAAVLFLQKAEDAKRIYQEILDVKQIYSIGNEVNTLVYPTVESQVEVMKGVLKDSGLTPDDISFVEASGVGIKKRDAEELQAIDAVYGNRKKPLLVGSVKSYIGCAIPANTVNAIIKIIVASETGMIPPTLHYEIPNSEALCLKDGRVEIPTELVPWTGPYSAVHTTAIAGTVSGVVLKAPNIEKKNDGIPSDDLPRLVVISGRTEEAITTSLDFMESRPVDVEFLQMMYDVFEPEIEGYLNRGYTLLPAKGVLPEDARKREILFNSGEKREVWWIFSGMGSQWVGMGEALLKLPIFEAAIKKCDDVLKPLGYDIYKIITEKDPQMFDQIINSFIGIAAIQIGLVDVLRALELEPDYLIGHSVGELGCAYADGCFTAEQMILAALSRGLASAETELIKGSMAAVGLGYEDVKPLCPPDIDVACHNGPESSTISGPAQSMKDFVANLTAKGIFAREVPSSNIAYHSRYIAAAGSKLLERLQKVIPEPNPRSAKWVSTSVPRAEWNNLKARFSSAEYHTNNLLNPVLFEETSRLIPEKAICIEIAPHGLLQAILNRSLPKSCINVPLTRRGASNNLETLLIAVGKLYNVGLQPKVSNLYPRIQYPVGRGTPPLSSLIKWDHSSDWPIKYFKKQGNLKGGEQTLEIDLNKEEFSYFRGNVINGKVAIPLSFCLVKAWDIIKNLQAEPILNVVFENLQIHKLIIDVPENEKISLTFCITKGTGNFEVTSSDTLLLTGLIKTTSTPEQERLNMFKVKGEEHKHYELNEDDFYTEMEMRGYKYADQFRIVSNSSIDDGKAVLKWSDNWVTYIDGALQFYTFRRDSRQVEMPLSIRKVVIDNSLHESIIQESNGTDIFVDEKTGYLSTGGLEMQGVKVSVVPQSFEQNRLSADTFVVVPNIQQSVISIATGLRLILQLVFENIVTSKTPVIQIFKRHDLEHVQRDILKHVPEESLFKIEFSNCYEEVTFSKALTVLQDEISNDDVTEISRKLRNGKFVLVFINDAQLQSFVKKMESSGLKLVFMRRLNREYMVLLKKRVQISKFHTIDISQNVTGSIQKIKNIKVQSEHERVVAIVRSGTEILLDDLRNRLKDILNWEKIRIYDIRNLNVPSNLLNKLLEEQLESDMSVNVLTAENNWASLRQVAVTLNPKLSKNWRANQKYLHDPTTFVWTEGPIVPNSKNIVKVEYSSLNSQDLLLANGSFYANSSKLIGKHRIEPISIGFEFSGTDTHKNRVMGIANGNALSNYVSADQNWIWNIPKSWSLEDAATVPLSYVIAYFACCIKGDIKSEEKVMIVNPCTEFGFATLNLALQKKCDVLVTYQNEEERKLLKSIYPNIPDKKLLKLYDVNLQDAILAATGTPGVDVVICNKYDIKEIDLLFTILVRNARVVFISDLSDNVIHKSIGMQRFLLDVGFASVVPEKVLLSDTTTKKLIADMLNDGINAGHVKPLPKVLYDWNSLNEALIACRENKHKAKIVVKTRPEGLNTSEVLIIPRLYCSENNSYLILEGLTNFGLELIDWLITRGARKFVVTSLSKVNNGYARLRMKYWQGYGIQINLHEECNYSNKKIIKGLFEETQSLGPLDGVFDLRQMNLKNNKFLDSFVQTTLAIDEESRLLDAHLRLLVACSIVTNDESMYSSSQIVEKVLKKRKEDGLPGLRIKWKLSESYAISKCIKKLEEILGTEEPDVEVSYFAPSNKEVEEDEDEITARIMNTEREEYIMFTDSLHKGFVGHKDFFNVNFSS